MYGAQQVRPAQLSAVPATTAAQFDISTLISTMMPLFMLMFFFMMMQPMMKGMSEAFK